MRHPAILALAAVALAWATLAGPPARPVSAQAPCRNVAIRSPVTGETVTGTVPVLGSAQIDGFQFYKVEWAPATEPDAWRAVSDIRRDAVINGLLDQWDSGRVPDGSYRLKLTVVDQAAVEVCRALVEDIVVGGGGTPTASVTPTETASPTPTEPAAEAPTAAAEEPATAEPTAGGDAGAGAGADATTAVTPTLAAIPPESSGAADDTSLGMDRLLGAFAGGFCLMLLAATLILLLFGRRGAR